MTRRQEMTAQLKAHRERLGVECFNTLTQAYGQNGCWILPNGLRSDNRQLEEALTLLDSLTDKVEEEELFDPELHLSEADAMHGLDEEPDHDELLGAEVAASEGLNKYPQRLTVYPYDGYTVEYSGERYWLRFDGYVYACGYTMQECEGKMFQGEFLGVEALYGGYKFVCDLPTPSVRWAWYQNGLLDSSLEQDVTIYCDNTDTEEWVNNGVFLCRLPNHTYSVITSLCDIAPEEAWDVEGVDDELVGVGVLACDVCHGQKTDLCGSRLTRMKAKYLYSIGYPHGEYCSLNNGDAIPYADHGDWLRWADAKGYEYCLCDYTPLTERSVQRKASCPIGLDCPGNGDCNECYEADKRLSAFNKDVTKWRTQQASWLAATQGHYRDY